jgi:hypothetical protein
LFHPVVGIRPKTRELSFLLPHKEKYRYGDKNKTVVKPIYISTQAGMLVFCKINAEG